MHVCPLYENKSRAHMLAYIKKSAHARLRARTNVTISIFRFFRESFSEIKMGLPPETLTWEISFLTIFQRILFMFLGHTEGGGYYTIPNMVVMYIFVT